MNLLDQYKDLLSKKRELENRMLSVAEVQYALDREAYFTVFPEENAAAGGTRRVHMQRFNINVKTSDSDTFRINDDGMCEVWCRAEWSADDEVVYDFDIDWSLADAIVAELLKGEKPECYAAYVAKRIAVYQTNKIERANTEIANLQRLQAQLARQRASLDAKLAALS